MLSRLFARFSRPRSRRAGLAWVPVLLGVAALGLSSACDKVPLLAPSGSTIALSTPVTILPINGTTQITADVISSGGQAVHNGTTITFTSNLGSFQPSSQAQTLNGQATVTFVAGTQSGVANITATSGAANVSLPTGSTGTSTGTTGTTNTAASSPTSLSIKIGGAAVSMVSLNANPATVPSSGGASTITATVLDANGNALGGVPVTFTTTAGSLSSSTVTSNASGQAQTTLTTAVKTTVSATAGVLGVGSSSSGSGTTTTTSPSSVVVDISAAPTVTITPPTTIPQVGQLATFNIVVTPAATGGSAISNATLKFGDGTTQSLGALTTSASGINVSHAYTTADTYLVTLSVTDATGQTISTSVPVTVSGVVSVSLSASPTSLNTHPGSATFTVSGIPSGVTVESYTWDFGDGQTATQSSTGGTISHNYTGSGSFTVKVTVTTSDGSSGTATLNYSVS